MKDTEITNNNLKKIIISEESLKMMEEEGAVFSRLIDEGYNEDQAWEIAMTRVGKEEADLDLQGSESELFIKTFPSTDLQNQSYRKKTKSTKTKT